MKNVEVPHTTASFKQFDVEQIAADIKETICRVSDAAFDAKENANIPAVDYEVFFLQPKEVLALVIS